ncbi:MAG: transcription antitermination factor NusB [Candidatus Omnitrophica bacterium]|nr:transcription antitermination factor NusB [Candidatus Omnitrophota bacterium]
MRKRTLAREFSLQLLYQLDITKEPAAEAALENFWLVHNEESIDKELKEFASKLVKGVISNLDEIDKKISQYAQNWQLKRMAVVDRNIMRMGCFELIYCDDIPAKVSINEAVDLAKKFSGVEAGKFVNAILDKIKAEKDK